MNGSTYSLSRPTGAAFAEEISGAEGSDKEGTSKQPGFPEPTVVTAKVVDRAGSEPPV
jgi:hypothetical protein